MINKPKKGNKNKIKKYSNNINIHKRSSISLNEKKFKIS